MNTIDKITASLVVGCALASLNECDVDNYVAVAIWIGVALICGAIGHWLVQRGKQPDYDDGTYDERNYDYEATATEWRTYRDTWPSCDGKQSRKYESRSMSDGGND